MENTIIDYSADVHTIRLKNGISEQLSRDKKLDSGRLDHLSTLAANYLITHPQKSKLVFDLLVNEGRKYALEELKRTKISQ